MGSLFTSLLNTANALQVYEKALTVTQNNVTNYTTPGYVKQTQTLQALRFDLSVGLPGGVSAGTVISARDAHAEQAVRDQQTGLGYYQQQKADLTPLETTFDLSSTTGIAPMIDGLFASFLQLSISPNDTVARQGVIDRASQLASTFQQTALQIGNQAARIDRDTRSTADEVNRLASIIAQINGQNRVDWSGGVDAGVDAQLNSTLEELSRITNYTALEQTDGTVTVYIGGQTPLVVGDQVHAIDSDFSTAQTAILSSGGKDITATLTGGKLSALLHDKNVLIPSYVSDLDTLAQTLANQVNATLQSGVDTAGAAPTIDLFTYDPILGAAVTLGVNAITPDRIAAALPGAPGGNGNTLALAALANTKAINGYTFAQYYGNLAGRVGRDLSAAKDSGSTKTQLLSQAQTLRQESSGVSLDEEAQTLMAFQKSYEATSKLLTVLNSLTDTLMNLIR